MDTPKRKRAYDPAKRAARYQREKQRALESGAPKRKRNYDPAKRAARYQREKQRAQAAGFETPYQQRRYRERQKSNPDLTVTAFQKSRMLVKFGITEGVFNAMRRSNIAHEPEGTRPDGKPASALAKRIQAYRVDIDAQEDNWTEERVGYITSFFWAVTSKGTNYFTMSENDRWEASQRTPRPKQFREWMGRQYIYLVRYGGFESIEEFEQRYGTSGSISQSLLDSFPKVPEAQRITGTQRKKG